MSEYGEQHSGKNRGRDSGGRSNDATGAIHSFITLLSPQFLSPNTVARLIGAPPGYIGKCVRVSGFGLRAYLCVYVYVQT